MIVCVFGFEWLCVCVCVCVFDFKWYCMCVCSALNDVVCVCSAIFLFYVRRDFLEYMPRTFTITHTVFYLKINL